MDSIFSKFSLQTFLRQLFCGVVFFCPFFLYALDWCNIYLGESEFSVVLSKDNFNVSLQSGTWETGKLMVVGVIACIIGTIIYHLEKNLYSYSVQCVFELYASKKNEFSWASPIIVSLLLTLALSPLIAVFADFSPICCFICYCLSFLFSFCIICSAFSRCFSKVIERTQKSWIVENSKIIESKSVAERNKEDDISSYKMAHSIADKVSTWSDFIHCVQSCCFAWMAGSCFVKYVLKTDVDIILGNSIAVSLLLLELIFDWHRYQHVIAMTDGSFSKPEC